MAGATSGNDGLHVNWGRDKIKDAPRIDTDGRLSPADSMGLYDYYGMPTQRTGTDDRHQGEQMMTRSEEQLNVGTKRVESGRVRLRKHVVTEEQQVTVPVSHEEIRIEREPADPRHAGKAKIGEEEQEVVLHEEKPVVAKEAVPVEQVRMRTEEVTEQQKIREKVRKERIDVDNDDAKRRDPRR